MNTNYELCFCPVHDIFVQWSGLSRCLESVHCYVICKNETHFVSLNLSIFFQKSHQKSPFKGLFLKCSPEGACPRTPLVLLGYQLRAPLLQKNPGETLYRYRCRYWYRCSSGLWVHTSSGQATCWPGNSSPIQRETKIRRKRRRKTWQVRETRCPRGCLSVRWTRHVMLAGFGESEFLLMHVPVLFPKCLLELVRVLGLECCALFWLAWSYTGLVLLLLVFLGVQYWFSVLLWVTMGTAVLSSQTCLCRVCAVCAVLAAVVYRFFAFWILFCFPWWSGGSGSGV